MRRDEADAVLAALDVDGLRAEIERLRNDMRRSHTDYVTVNLPRPVWDYLATLADPTHHAAALAPAATDKTLCSRCGTDVVRLRACPECGAQPRRTTMPEQTPHREALDYCPTCGVDGLRAQLADAVGLMIETSHERDDLRAEVERLRAQVGRVRALATRLRAAGIVSVYESSLEIGDMIDAALDGREDQ